MVGDSVLAPELEWMRNFWAARMFVRDAMQCNADWRGGAYQIEQTPLTSCVFGACSFKSLKVLCAHTNAGTHTHTTLRKEV